MDNGAYITLVSNAKEIDAAFERVVKAMREFHEAAYRLQYLISNTTLNINFGDSPVEKPEGAE